MIQRCLLGRGKGISGQRETREGRDEGKQSILYTHMQLSKKFVQYFLIMLRKRSLLSDKAVLIPQEKNRK